MTYIENCFFITPKIVEISLNRPRKISDKSDYRRFDVTYTYEENALLVTVDDNLPQKILLEEIETAFYAPKKYFLCPGCDCRVQKLYLLPEGTELKCRVCHGIKYQTFNTSSKHGRLFDRTKKIIKLTNDRANMTRIWYNDTYTKHKILHIHKKV